MDDEAVDDVLREMKRALEQDTSSTPGPGCPTQDALDALAVGELPAAEADVAMAHVGGCARCARYLSLAVEAERPLADAALEEEIARARQALDPAPSPASADPAPGLWERFVAWLSEPWLRPVGALALAGVLIAVVGVRLLPPASTPGAPVAVQLDLLPGFQAATQGDAPPVSAGGVPVYTTAGLLALALRTAEERPDLSAAAWVVDPAGRVAARCPSPSCTLAPRVDGFRLEAAPAAVFLSGPGEYVLLMALGTAAQLDRAAESMAEETGDLLVRRAALGELGLSWVGELGVRFQP